MLFRSGIAEQEHRPNFGFFPLGTVNDLARALGIPREPEEAINHFSIESVKPLDIGKINDVSTCRVYKIFIFIPYFCLGMST